MPKAQISSSTTGAGAVSISDKQRQGRAVNAVAELLARKLLVPKIYLAADWRGENADVLAIDRAGSGDIHGVQIPIPPQSFVGPKTRFLNQIRLEKIDIPRIVSTNFHFKYLAVVPAFVDFLSRQNLFAEDGIGRVGIIEIIEHPSGSPEARIAIPAERFRVAPATIKKFDEFQKKTHADRETRG